MRNNEVEILAGHVSKDHIHLLVSAPPHLSISKLARYLKGEQFKENADEIQRIEQTILEATLVGMGIFCSKQREFSRGFPLLEFLSERMWPIFLQELFRGLVGCGNRMKLGVTSATRLTECLLPGFFKAPVPSGYALMLVESSDRIFTDMWIIPFSCISIEAFCNIPFLVQRRNRTYIVFQ